MAVDRRDDRRAWLRLTQCGLDAATLAPLLRELRHPADLLELSDAGLHDRHQLDQRQIARLRKQPSHDEIERQLDLVEEHRIDIVPLSDRAYPANLFRMRVSPPLIFVQGKIEPYDSLSIGIVGPRNATHYAIGVTRRFARDFAATFTIVSGAALGIDSVAHEETLKAGGRTIAVIGCGHDVNYPAGNSALRKRIAEDRGGAIVSIYPPGTQPLRQNFPERNLVLAGLSLAVLVVEASARSGALVTARAAGEEGRPVYAVPGDITRRNSEGSNALLRDGATVCTSAQDVLADLEMVLLGELELVNERKAALARESPGGESARFADSAPAPASPVEDVILREVRHQPISHDDLIARYVPERITLADLATALLMLELNGHIEQLPGRLYAAKL